MPTQTITPTQTLTLVLDVQLYQALEHRAQEQHRAEKHRAEKQAGNGEEGLPRGRRPRLSVSGTAVALLRLALRAKAPDLAAALETVTTRRAENPSLRFTVLCPADLHAQVRQHPFAQKTSAKAFLEAAIALPLLQDLPKQLPKKSPKPKATEKNRRQCTARN